MVCPNCGHDYPDDARFCKWCHWAPPHRDKFAMENISGQLNPLVTKAEEEAASAGDAGKGFAAIAAEIRKLAEYSGEQSRATGGDSKATLEYINKQLNLFSMNAMMEVAHAGGAGGFMEVAQGIRKLAEYSSEQVKKL